MAQYTVTAGCGHTVSINLVGKSGERERRLAWMRSPGGKCNACYATMKGDEEAHQHEIAIQAIVTQVLNQLDRLPADQQAAALQQLRAGVSERMRLAPIEAGKDARVAAAIRVLSERAS